MTRLDAAHLELAVGYRQHGSLARVTARVAARIGVAGVGSARAAGRADAAAEPVSDGAVEVLTAPHTYAQSRAIAARLRRERHEHNTPWAQMVVIARSRAQLRDLRSDLLAADIPCESLGDGVALHREPAVAPLLTILRVALGEAWTQDSAASVLGSRLIGLDPVGLRRLRRELLREERAGGGERGSAELLLEALAAPNGFASVRGPEARLAARAAAAVSAAAARAAEDGRDGGRGGLGGMGGARGCRRVALCCPRRILEGRCRSRRGRRAAARGADLRRAVAVRDGARIPRLPRGARLRGRRSWRARPGW